MVLSVVVTVVDGARAVERCLQALAAQEDPPALDVVVPYDETARGVGELAGRFPSVRFLPLGPLETARPVSTPAGQHELFDRRRAAGLAAVRGELVAILEDRGVPRVDWARTAVGLHALPYGVIGGAIQNGRDRLLNWAVYFCDFSRYQLPFEPGVRSYVSDVNICYKRAAVDATRSLWADRYHETTVHWELARLGETLFLAPSMVVDQMREGLALPSLVRERFDWGRLFAYTRAREVSRSRRLTLAVLSPLLPAVLFVRHAMNQVHKRAALGSFLVASPLVFLLLLSWSAGEMVGYLTGES